MTFSLLNNSKKLRSIWWVVIFFVVLASITFPVILLSQYYHFEITIIHQALIVIIASIICQLSTRQPLSKLFGAFNIKELKRLFLGFIIGAGLMIFPALFLFMSRMVSWQFTHIDLLLLLPAILLFVGVAIAEELLFHGFIFQMLIKSVGIWPAQIIISAYFLLTHINNPGMTGGVKVLASINIFLAAVMFGLAFIKTKSLSMSIGMHFMANCVQGVVLGFGVSGNEQASLLKPIYDDAPVWLTGGSFGLEASVPGLIAVMVTLVFLYRWQPSTGPVYKTDKEQDIAGS